MTKKSFASVLLYYLLLGRICYAHCELHPLDTAFVALATLQFFSFLCNMHHEQTFACNLLMEFISNAMAKVEICQKTDIRLN